MNIHYPCRGGLDYPGCSAYIRLYMPRFFLTYEPRGNADFLRMLVHVQTCFPFNLVLGDDPFLCVPVWDLFLDAVGV
jgi:hypothetical protein